MNEHRLGIIGGMGPQATNTFYQYIIDRTDAHSDQEHLSVLIFSDSDMPDRTVPCNTAHYFLDRVQEQVGVPILHMIRETARLLVSQGRKRPGILATDGTIQTGLYQREFAALGLEPVAPGPEAQRQIMSLIYDDIKAGKLGDPEKFAAAHQDLIAQGCDCAILACTELSVFATQHPLSTFFIDAMAVLAERAVQACHKPLRQIHSK